jgi:PAS domain S-box-containing protein
MKLPPSLKRCAQAFAIAAAGALGAWLAWTPWPLLVTITAVCICRGWKPGLAVMLVADLCAYGMQAPLGSLDALPALAVFAVCGLGIWLLVLMFRSERFFDRVYEGMRPSVEDIPGLGWFAYPGGRLRFINPAALDFIGISAEEMRRLMDDPDDTAWFAPYLHPDDRERCLVNWRHSMKTGEPVLEEARVRRHDGQYFWFRDTAVAARDERGRIIGWYGHTQDIDVQKKAEAALHERERELRLLVDTVPSLIWLMTPEGLPTYFNKRFVDWAGVEPGDAASPVGRPLATYTELIHPDDLEEALASFRQSFASGEPLNLKYRLRGKDGWYRWVDSRVAPLRDETGTIIRWYGANLDVDDEVRSQEALRLADERLARALRAASLSELSVSIAHELNQPLQAVVANVGAFQRWLSADPPNYQHASRIAEKITRDTNAAAQVLGRIRALFAQTTDHSNVVDLNAVITEVCDLTADKLQASNVRLEVELDPRLPETGADHVQMEQVVFNLVRNSIEAMQVVDARARALRILSRRQGEDRIEIEVRDCGPGITDPERIFDAFYTTKSDGMGMGLAICRSIVEAHGGRVWASNVPTGGASVVVSLPIRGSDAAAEDLRPASRRLRAARASNDGA